jgi:hypothetical protein
MNEFLAMAHDIIKKYRMYLNNTVLASSRQKLIIEMITELKLMKEAWEVINGPAQPTGMSFEEAIKSITN